MTGHRKLAMLYGVVITLVVLFLMWATGGTPPGGIWLFSIVCGLAGGATFAMILAIGKKGRGP